MDYSLQTKKVGSTLEGNKSTVKKWSGFYLVPFNFTIFWRANLHFIRPKLHISPHVLQFFISKLVLQRF